LLGWARGTDSPRSGGYLPNRRGAKPGGGRNLDGGGAPKMANGRLLNGFNRPAKKHRLAGHPPRLLLIVGAGASQAGRCAGEGSLIGYVLVVAAPVPSPPAPPDGFKFDRRGGWSCQPLLAVPVVGPRAGWAAAVRRETLWMVYFCRVARRVTSDTGPGSGCSARPDGLPSCDARQANSTLEWRWAIYGGLRVKNFFSQTFSNVHVEPAAPVRGRVGRGDAATPKGRFFVQRQASTPPPQQAEPGHTTRLGDFRHRAARKVPDIAFVLGRGLVRAASSQSLDGQQVGGNAASGIGHHPLRLAGSRHHLYAAPYCPMDRGGGGQAHGRRRKRVRGRPAREEAAAPGDSQDAGGQWGGGGRRRG